VSTRVKVINSVWNGSGLLKRKVAEHYVREGRAEWVADGQLRLILSHPKNQAAAERAHAWEANFKPCCDRDRTTQALMLYGPTVKGGLMAKDQSSTRFEAPPSKAPAFCDPRPSSEM
jgi:hypothetical protein